MLHAIRLYLLLCCPILAQAQFFTGTGGPIPDDGTTKVFDLTVFNLPASIDTQSFGLESVCLNLTHTWNADLSISLQAPDGTTVTLFSGIGGDTDGFVNTCLNGNSTDPITSGNHPFTGTFRPLGELGLVNSGQNPNGVWKLIILDTYAFADEGSLIDWTLNFGSDPSTLFPFSSSDLPILHLITDAGAPIPNEPKLDATLEVWANNTGQLNFTSNPADQTHDIGVELHGNSTQGFPKKSYKIEVRDPNTGLDKDVSLLGLPSTSDYVLLANYSDKTLMRNALTYELSRQMGQYATQGRFCEVMLNGSYQGVYLLLERIKRGSERLDIPKLEPKDTVGNDLTGGYILKVDWESSPGWYSAFDMPNNPGNYTFFQHYYPRWDEIQPAQQHYIRTYVDSFEQALAGPAFQDPTLGWRRFGEEQSFMDFLIMNELSKNVDGYRLSTYLHKQRDDRGGKLRMGPVWDFDLAWFNADYCEGWLASGWQYNINFVCPDGAVPFWWQRFEEDTLFQQNLACRWQSLRQTTLSEAHIYAVIDSMAAVVEQAQTRNFNYWGTLGIYVWPNPQPIPDTYAGEVAKLKNWVAGRLEWMDSALNPQLPDLNADFQVQGQNVFLWQFSANTQNGVLYHWDFGDGQTADQPNPSHTFAGIGTYTVQLTVSTPFGCSATSAQTIQIVNSTTTVTAEALRILPNPTTGYTRLVFPAHLTEEKQIRVTDALGRTVVTALCPAQTLEFDLDLNTLAPGTYEVQMVSGRYNVSKSVLKQGN